MSVLTAIVRQDAPGIGAEVARAAALNWLGFRGMTELQFEDLEPDDRAELIGYARDEPGWFRYLPSPAGRVG